MEGVSLFLLKKAHFYPCLLQSLSRCASRGTYREDGHETELYIHLPEPANRHPHGILSSPRRNILERAGASISYTLEGE